MNAALQSVTTLNLYEAVVFCEGTNKAHLKLKSCSIVCVRSPLLSYNQTLNVTFDQRLCLIARESHFASPSSSLFTLLGEGFLSGGVDQQDEGRWWRWHGTHRSAVSPVTMVGVRCDRMEKRSEEGSPSQPRPCQQAPFSILQTSQKKRTPSSFFAANRKLLLSFRASSTWRRPTPPRGLPGDRSALFNPGRLLRTGASS